MPKQTPLKKANSLIEQIGACIWIHGKDEVPNDNTKLEVYAALITVQEVIDADPYQYIKDYYTRVKAELEKML